MMHHTVFAYGVAGVLALSMALGGCGGTGGSSSDGSDLQATTEDTSSSVPQDPAVLFWRGTTDTGATFFFFEDQVNATGRVTILHADETLYSIEGSLYVAADGTATITRVVPADDYEEEDAEPKTETYSFRLTDVNQTSLLIDAGENGKGTLRPSTEAEFSQALAELYPADEYGSFE